MIAMPSGASGMSIVHRSIRNVRPSSHSNLTRAAPGHGGPPGGPASIVHSPTRASRRSSAGFRLDRCTDAPFALNGEGQNRTADTTIFSRVLYQLSYLAGGGKASDEVNRFRSPGTRRAGPPRQGPLRPRSQG